MLQFGIAIDVARDFSVLRHYSKAVQLISFLLSLEQTDLRRSPHNQILINQNHNRSLNTRSR